MKPEDYAWNAHERKCYENSQVILPSPYKLKILDDGEERLELELVLEQLPQGQLARWAMKIASSFILLIDAKDESEKQRILPQIGAIFQARLDGRASAYELRTAGFLANKLSRQAQSQIGKYAARVFAQAVATAHMRGHAIVAADYAIKVRNLQSPDDLQRAVKEREGQIELASAFIRSGKETL
ncbi:hypothetical protein FFV08_05550 [Streptococcus sanguinis]|uniref:Imm-5-like domain-containing protein n=1 Tax=Streptococcus sanguinis TaxID=1305 RepID=A0A7H8V6G6_STRSA|nr:hypothetical protein FFV08_05550 [Streptococcus sanguinis]